MPEKINLNVDQEMALNALVAFCDEDHLIGSKEAGLFGYAGTGKTTTIIRLLERLDVPVIFTAPTNKAAKVLRKMAHSAGVQIEVSTIHSLLGLAPVQKGDKQIFKPKGKSRFGDYAIVVVDECSMVSCDLYQHIKKAQSYTSTRVIHMGDPAQLPPVGEDISPTFRIAQSSELTQVMRQRDENPILGVCTDIREVVTGGGDRMPLVHPAHGTGGAGVHVMVGDMWAQWMPSAFTSDDFANDPDSFRVIAYRNQTVKYLNGQIQAMRYPDLMGPFAIGEPVVFSSPLKFGGLAGATTRAGDPINIAAGVDDIVIPTEMEGEVVAVRQEQHAEYSIYDTYLVDVLVRGARMGDVVFSCWFAGQRGRARIDEELGKLADVGRANGGRAWKPFWDLKSAFADLRPAYAMTAHKSQGSTFGTVFVDVLDILYGNRNRQEAMRCLYVACSRASDNLILNHAGGI
jgi:exodeoxyribonuclease-5